MIRQPTVFEQSVYDLLMRIPSGKVVTYKEMAKSLDCNSAQAIGQALKRNPHAPEVPCHRVIKTDGNIGGYSGETIGPKLQKKIDLLASEGVAFDRYGFLTKEDVIHHFE